MTDAHIVADTALPLPEIVLVIGASLVLGADLFFRPSSSREPLLTASILVIGATMAASLALLGRTTFGFGGMLVVDNFAVYFKLLVLLAAALVLLSAETFTERVGEYTSEFYG